MPDAPLPRVGFASAQTTGRHIAEYRIDDRVRWTRLDIVDTAAGGPADLTGVVEFRAPYRAGKTRGVLHERSSFVRLDGRWLYLSG